MGHLRPPGFWACGEEMAVQLRRKDRSRILILEAANAIFAELGFETATIDAIATRAGLTRKTAYNLFASKEDIADHLIERLEAHSEPLYRHRIEGCENALALIESILLENANWCMANPTIAKLALAPRRRPTLAPPPDRASFQRIVRDTISLGQQQGILRKDESPDFMSMILLGIYAQAMLSAISASTLDQADIKRIIRLLVEGIGHRK